MISGNVYKKLYDLCHIKPCMRGKEAQVYNIHQADLTKQTRELDGIVPTASILTNNIVFRLVRMICALRRNTRSCSKYPAANHSIFWKHCLIIDTSRPGIGLLLGDNSNYIETDRQSLALQVEVEKFLGENNLSWKDLTAVGVVVGPGSFTGIRLGIAYAKGLGIGLNIPVIPINAFEIYLQHDPDAFVAIDSGKTDLYVGAADMEPGTMEIEQIETVQMKYPKTVGHKPYDLKDALPVVMRKITQSEPVVPMYLRPSYAEINKS